MTAEGSASSPPPRAPQPPGRPHPSSPSGPSCSSSTEVRGSAEQGGVGPEADAEVAGRGGAAQCGAVRKTPPPCPPPRNTRRVGGFCRVQRDVDTDETVLLIIVNMAPREAVRGPVRLGPSGGAKTRTKTKTKGLCPLDGMFRSFCLRESDDEEGGGERGGTGGRREGVCTGTREEPSRNPVGTTHWTGHSNQAHRDTGGNWEVWEGLATTGQSLTLFVIS